ncbi:MAG TPA: CBS domain-containing protein [Candidatus Polarisedimenticolaceae bacterium]|nr:CBS domain-containing protein [Candidatus Polarisedimenticolaceae bacterium]
MVARDLMSTEIFTIRADATVAALCDLLQAAHVNGVPVLGDEGDLVGIVTEEDVLYGTMGAPQREESGVLVRDIMTSPAVCATEDTDVVDLCRMMWGMRIHRIPIVVEGRITGIVAAMDLVRAVADGRLAP